MARFLPKEHSLKYSSASRGFPAGNPIANIFVIIVGALVISASIVLGFFAFVIVGSVVLIMAAIIGLRVWWFKRKFRGQMPPDANKSSAATGGVIEGEFKVVADDREDE
jgi:predicted lipid-binding transport protein (Tim44 family)